MSIYYSGKFTRSGGVVSAITKQLKLMNLKPVKRVQVQFDPFHPKAVTAREFLYYLSTPKVLETNASCAIKTNIVCDRSEPQINLELLKPGNIKFLLNNLTVLEVLQLINKHVSSTVKVEEPIVENKLITKKLKRR